MRVRVVKTSGSLVPDHAVLGPGDTLVGLALRRRWVEPLAAVKWYAHGPHDYHLTQNGFTWHPHRGLEIYTWVLEGTLSHEDTTGGMGQIDPGEFQRMFSGEWIEHQELNHGDVPVRVIQIWYVADLKYRGLVPHYQQLRHEQLPSRRAGDATIFSLIVDGSPIEQHMAGRLTAAWVDPGGQTRLEAPAIGEDMFL